MTKLAYSTLLGVFIGMFILSQQVMGQKVTFIEDFSLVDGQKNEVKLSDFSDKKAVVVVFTSSHCSWATKYEDRLKELHTSYVDKDVAVIAVNSNDASMNELDGGATMRQITVFPFPYLKDEEQAVAKQFEATKNPEAVLLIPKGNKFEVVYRGKIDDNPLDSKLVRHNFLNSAIDKTLEGKKLEDGDKLTSPSGCNIKWIEEQAPAKPVKD